MCVVHRVHDMRRLVGFSVSEVHCLTGLFITLLRVGLTTPQCTVRSYRDDINATAFHPAVGAGFVYGTRKGALCTFLPQDVSREQEDDEEEE